MKTGYGDARLQSPYKLRLEEGEFETSLSYGVTLFQKQWKIMWYFLGILLMAHNLQLEYREDDRSINVSALRGNAKKGRKGGGEACRKQT